MFIPKTVIFACVLALACIGGWAMTQVAYAEAKLVKITLDELPFKLGMTQEQAKQAAAEPFMIRHCPPNEVPGGRPLPTHCYEMFKDNVSIGGIDFENGGPLSEIFIQPVNVDNHDAKVYAQTLVDALDRLAESGNGKIEVQLDRKPLHLPDNRTVTFSSGSRSLKLTVIGIDPAHNRVVLDERLVAERK